MTALASKDRLPLTSRLGIDVALLALGLSAGAALAHRFVSSDSMAYHVSILRMQLRDGTAADIANEKAARNRRFKFSSTLLVAAASFLSIGALALAVSFIGLLKKIGG